MVLCKGLTEFTLDHVKDRILVLKMLKYDNDLQLSEKGKEIYRNPAAGNFTLEAMSVIKRITLKEFGFLPSETSLNNYCKIIDQYYHNPDDYDTEVMNSVVYFRENRLLYYKTPPISVGDNAPNCQIMDPDSDKILNLSEILENNLRKGYDSTVVAGFSSS